MEEIKQVTPMEGIDMALNQLNGISVPVVLTEQITIPMAKAIDLIKKCLPFLVEKQPDQEAEKQPEVKLEVLDGPPSKEESTDA